MSARPTPVYWPIQLTLWAVVATLSAFGEGSRLPWFLLICAVLTLGFSWFTWAHEGDGGRAS